MRYSYGENRIKEARLIGFESGKNGVIKSMTSGKCSAYFVPLDAGAEDALWGRLAFDITSEGEISVTVRYGAANNTAGIRKLDTLEERKEIYEGLGLMVKNDITDFTLYDLCGRYLFLMIEVNGDGNAEIANLRVYTEGDNFMQTFPGVYQERDSFFHRFMSVFSSMYRDMEEEVIALPKLLDLDTCPKELLPVYGNWLGIDVGEGFLEEEILRTLVKEAYELSRMKGTRWSLERVTQILLGEKALVVERNNASDYLKEGQLEDFNRLYGSNPNDVTIMMQEYLPEVKLSQFKYILEQFIPVTCRLYIVTLPTVGSLDTHTYMDVNSSVYNSDEGTLDEGAFMDQSFVLR